MMNVRLLSVVAAITFISVAEAAPEGTWRIGAGMGQIERFVENGPGNRLNVSCGEGASQGATIIVAIKDKLPSSPSTVRIFVNDKMFDFYAKGGGIDTQSRVGAYTFWGFWSSLKKARSVRVLFENGDTATFPTKGAARAFRGKPCKTGFEM
jgi:hypothetical protein